MKKVILNSGESISYREIGNGNNVLVCLHGNMCSSFEFQFFFDNIDLLKDFKIFAPDFRGFGESSYNSPVNSFEGYGDDIIEFLDLLGIYEFNLLGHYIGGGVAMEIASKLKERVNKLILVSSVGTQGIPLPALDQNGQVVEGLFLTNREDIERDVLRVLPLQQIFELKDKMFLKSIFEDILFNVTKVSELEIDSYLEDAFTQKSVVDVYCALSNFNISYKFNGVKEGNNKIEEITAETLVIQGSNDQLCPFDFAYLIKYSLKSKSKIVTGNFGHSPFIDSPLWVIDTINEFIL